MGGNGKIILLNGASSAGKSTLATAILGCMDEPFLCFSIDFFMFNSRILPGRRDPGGPFSWMSMRLKLFQGYFNCLPAMANAGNNLVVDYIIESNEQLKRLKKVLEGLDVFFVGVHCPLPELERRERERGDRNAGDARKDLETVHSFGKYDFEVDSSGPVALNAGRIVEAWRGRGRMGVFHETGVNITI